MSALTVDFVSSLPPDQGEATLIAFVDKDLAPAVPELDQGIVARAAADAGFRGDLSEALPLFLSENGHIRRIVLVGSVPRTDEGKARAIELGGHAARKAGFGRDIIIVAGDADALAAAQMALGFRLSSYRFDLYRSKIDEPVPPGDRKVTIVTRDAPAAKRAFEKEIAVARGVELARNLVNEPANILNPQEFARRVGALRDLGLEVEILRAADLERLGFRALLAVGQGSAQESHAAILRWNGARDSAAPPLAAIGKGVCFDTGGISIKPSLALDEMKGDMAGAAAVTGFMMALALRRAPINAVGAIGLVENMPDGKAQRPGDVVRSLSGQTIEVVDTDYEGRLVLADLLWHVQDRYRPRFMIDLATLTDAVGVGIGRDYAGLFSNDEELAERLRRVGEATGEIVWRLPLGPGFDRQIDSTIADVRNIDGRAGGGSTSANFLKRFVNGRPWAHLDIAGPAQNMPESAINRSWGTGWGVRLLDGLARELEEA